MRADRLIASAAAAALLAGLGVAIAATSGHDAKPTAAATPVTSPTATPTPTPSATPTHPAVRRTASPPSASYLPLPAPAAYPTGCPPRPLPPGPPFHPPTPSVATAKLPAALPLAARHVDLKPVSGKGMWLTVWPDSTLDAARVVAQASAAGLRQLWLRTGGTPQGWYGRRFLDALLPRAHAAGIAVVAWDFPMLSDPVADAKRAALAITGTFAGQHVDAFSPDIETIYEGTFDTARRVALYLSMVRHVAGNLPIVATVMRPTPYQLSTYPYRAEAPYVDVFAPMVYWSCSEPGALALAAYRNLAKLRPVHLIGQSYDMAPEGGRRGLPSAREIWRFLDIARRAGAIGASLYVYSETRAPQWTALARYPWS